MHTGDAGYFNASGPSGRHRPHQGPRRRPRTATRFSPQYIENKLKFSPYVAEAVILGAGRDYLAAMICIRYSIVSQLGREEAASPSPPTPISPSRPEVYDLIRREVEAVNATLPPGQRIAKFLLLYKELDADDGELTRTRKVRRSVIGEKYGDIIAAIYAGDAAIAVDTLIRFQDGTTQRIQTTLAVVTLDAPEPAPLPLAAE